MRGQEASHKGTKSTEKRGWVRGAILAGLAMALGGCTTLSYESPTLGKVRYCYLLQDKEVVADVQTSGALTVTSRNSADPAVDLVGAAIEAGITAGLKAAGLEGK